MVHPGKSNPRNKGDASQRLRPERLAQLIQAHQEAILAHPEEQETHEAILSLLEGIAAGEITAARLACAGSRAQALRFADAPAAARLYRQAATDLERASRAEHNAQR